MAKIKLTPPADSHKLSTWLTWGNNTGACLMWNLYFHCRAMLRNGALGVFSFFLFHFLLPARKLSATFAVYSVWINFAAAQRPAGPVIFRFRLWSLAAILLIASSSASAVDAFNPENGHYYRYFPSIRQSWDAARVVAFSQTHNGLRGHLATITSESEQAFVEGFASDETTWLGGFQPAGSLEPGGSWQWVTGEPFSHSNWAPFEPNDYYGEHLIEMWRARSGVGSGYWNDVSATQYAGHPEITRRAFVIEFTPGYVPKLNGTDFLNWQRDLGRPSRFGRADFDGDGVVSGADLEVWRTVGFVPEPAAATLLIINAGLYLALRRSPLLRPRRARCSRGRQRLARVQ